MNRLMRGSINTINYGIMCHTRTSLLLGTNEPYAPSLCLRTSDEKKKAEKNQHIICVAYILSRARGAGSRLKPTRPLQATTRHGAETL